LKYNILIDNRKELFWNERQERGVKKAIKKNCIKFRCLMTLFLVLFISSVVVFPCASAASMWDKTYGGTGEDTGWGDLFQTSDEGYVVSGDTKSFGAGDKDFWLLKVDADGNMEWNKTYGGTSRDYHTFMCQTSDGGYALAGDTTSFGAGNKDFWLVKTDTDGNMEWNMTYGGTAIETEPALCLTSDGGYALAGYTISFGAGSQDGWLVKTDTDGNMEWNMTYGGTYNDQIYLVVAAPDGGFIIGGNTMSFGEGGMDVWLVKTDTDGNMEWNMTYGGTGFDWGMHLIQTLDEGYAILAVTNSFGAGDADYWLIKTDSDGNMLWNKTYGETGFDFGVHVLQTVEGGYAIIGFTDSFGAGGTDAWLVKTDVDGIMRWNQTYGGAEDDEGWSLIETSDGGYALAGNTYSFGAGDQDFYVVKTDEFGVVPESFTSIVVALLSTIAVTVSFWLLRKRPKLKNALLEKP
jgi:hypothetical protein